MRNFEQRFSLAIESLTPEQQNAAAFWSLAADDNVPLSGFVACECGKTHKEAVTLFTCIYETRERALVKLLGPRIKRKIEGKLHDYTLGNGRFQRKGFGAVYDFWIEACSGPYGAELRLFKSALMPDFDPDASKLSPQGIMDAFEAWKMESGAQVAAWLKGARIYPVERPHGQAAWLQEERMRSRSVMLHTDDRRVVDTLGTYQMVWTVDTGESIFVAGNGPRETTAFGEKFHPWALIHWWNPKTKTYRILESRQPELVEDRGAFYANPEGRWAYLIEQGATVHEVPEFKREG